MVTKCITFVLHIYNRILGIPLPGDYQSLSRIVYIEDITRVVI